MESLRKVYPHCWHEADSLLPRKWGLIKLKLHSQKRHMIPQSADTEVTAWAKDLKRKQNCQKIKMSSKEISRVSLSCRSPTPNLCPQILLKWELACGCLTLITPWHQESKRNNWGREREKKATMTWSNDAWESLLQKFCSENFASISRFLLHPQPPPPISLFQNTWIKLWMNTCHEKATHPWNQKDNSQLYNSICKNVEYMTLNQEGISPD